MAPSATSLPRYSVEAFAREVRASVDAASARLMVRGQAIIDRLEAAYRDRADAGRPRLPSLATGELLRCRMMPYSGPDDLQRLDLLPPEEGWPAMDFFGVAPAPVPYAAFKARMEQLTNTTER